MPSLAIETSGLTKAYRSRKGQITAVERLELHVPKGVIFGLLGPNGAGKTTTIRMLCGLIRPSGGTATVEGIRVDQAPDAVRARVGLVSEDAGVHPNLTLEEDLAYHGSLFGLSTAAVRERSSELIDRLGLGPRRAHRLGGYSNGMRRKAHLIRALLHRPAILLLDEPTAGLDPATVDEVWKLLRTLSAEQGVTIILCSHHLEEVERICGHVAILRQRLLAVGPLAELSGADRQWRIELADPFAGASEALAGLDGIRDIASGEHSVSFSIDGEAASVVPQAVARLVEQGAAILTVARAGRDLRALYRSVVEGGEA